MPASSPPGLRDIFRLSSPARKGGGEEGRKGGKGKKDIRAVKLKRYEKLDTVAWKVVLKRRSQLNILCRISWDMLLPEPKTSTAGNKTYKYYTVRLWHSQAPL